MPLPPKLLMADMICAGTQMLLYTDSSRPVRIGDRMYDNNKIMKVVGGIPPMVTVRYLGVIDEFFIPPSRIHTQWVDTDNWLKGKYDPPVGSRANPHPPVGSN